MAAAETTNSDNSEGSEGSDNSEGSTGNSEGSTGSDSSTSSLGRRRGGWLRGLALASVVAAFALIVLGGVVRVTGSGLGCPDWPLCHGNIIPPLEKTAIIEYSHRLVASGIVGPLIIATCAVAWIGYRRERRLVIPATAAVILLLAQGGLGGVTVLTELPSHIVAAHMALAQALLGCLILILVAAHRITGPATGLPRLTAATPERPTGETAGGKGNGADRFPRLALISAVATYVLLLSGSFVTATPGALAACPDWPLCQGFGISLPSGHLSAIHMLHRVVAAGIGLLIIYTLHLGFRAGSGAPNIDEGDGKGQDQNQRRNRSGTVRSLAVAGVILFLVQILVGALAIWTHFPAELRALHLALATAVWSIMAALALLSYGRRSSRAEIETG
jgi:heme A synthase